MREPAKLNQSKSGNQSEAVIWQEKKGKILENLRSYSTQEKLFKLWKNKYESVEDLTKNHKLTLDQLQSIIKSQPNIDFSRDSIIIEMQNRIDVIDTLKTKNDFDAVYPNPDKEISFLDSLSSSRTSQIQRIEQLLNNKLIDETKREAKEQAKREAETKALKKAEEQAKREAKEQAKREAKEQAKREAEEPAKRKAEEKAKREAEEQAKREAEEQAKREAEEQAKREAEEKSQKAVAKQQRRAEYLEKINLEKVDGIISEAISKIEDGIVNELASKFVAEEVSKLEEEDRIKSKTVADAVDRIENKIIDELLPEYVNKVADGLLTEYINQLVDKLVNEVVNEAVEEIATESFAEAKTEEKAKIEAEERSRLKDQIRADIESEVREEIEARLRGEIEARLRGEIEARVREELKVAHKNEITELKARFDSDIRVLNDGFRKEMEIAQNEFEDKTQNQSEMRVKLEKLEATHKINLGKKINEVETKLHSEYKKLLNERILEEQKRHAIELEEIFAQLYNKRGVGEITPENFPPLAQAPRLGLGVKKSDKDIISELNSVEQIQNFLGNNPEDRIQKLTGKCYQENSFICKILQNCDNDYLTNFITKYKDKVQECISSDINVIVFMMESIKEDRERLQKIAQIATLIPTSYNSANTTRVPIIDVDDSHELIFKIITNDDITSTEKIQKLNIVKAITPEESWKDAANKKKKSLTLFQTAILSGDSILVKYFISNNKKIDETNFHGSIFVLSLSNKIDANNKLEILTKILNSAPKGALNKILNKKSTSDHTLLDDASQCDENYILKLTAKGARLTDCKKIHEFINYAFNSINFEKFVDNAKKNREENIFGTINSDCQNLFHHLSNNNFNLTPEQISDKFNKLYRTMDQEQFLNSINQVDKAGFSPLDLAIKNNNAEFALELVKKGANKNYILNELYYSKNYDMMEAFYEKGLIRFTEIPEQILEKLVEDICKKSNHDNFDIKFFNFIQDNLANEKLKKAEKSTEEKSSQPSSATQQVSSSSLDPQPSQRY